MKMKRTTFLWIFAPLTLCVMSSVARADDVSMVYAAPGTGNLAPGAGNVAPAQATWPRRKQCGAQRSVRLRSGSLRPQRLRLLRPGHE